MGVPPGPSAARERGIGSNADWRIAQSGGGTAEELLAIHLPGGQTPTDVSTSTDLQREPFAELTPLMLRRAQLSIVRRGYKPEEVDALLQAAATALERAQTEATSLRELAHHEQAPTPAPTADAGTTAEEFQLVDAERRRLDQELGAAHARIEAHSQELDRREAELTRLQDELARLRSAHSTQRADAESRLEALRAELLQARADRDQAASHPSPASLARPQLMEQVGDVVGKLLRDAEATAQQLREEADTEAHQLTIQSRAEAERVRREADQQALLIRREAQENADALAAEARRDADSLRREAETAAQILRDQAARDASITRRAAEKTRDDLVRTAEAAAREMKETAEREARRIELEAEALAEGKVRAAEAQAEQAQKDAETRAREIEDELSVVREREQRLIEQMREAREALATHLQATRSGLERVLNQVADDHVRQLVGGNGEVVDARAETVYDTVDDAADPEGEVIE
ncbi:MAG: DivIVA domain-containing protein [Thermoleophilia bacterium]